MEITEQEILSSLKVLQKGGLLFFPTDYGWCVGCDATSEVAVSKLRQLLQKPLDYLPVLLAEERDIIHWVAAADLSVFDFVAEQDRPTAIVFENGLGFADSLPAIDGSVLILLTQHPFCRHLVKRFRLPVIALPCSLVEAKHLPGNGTPDFGLQTAKPNFTAIHPPLAGALQIVHWNNGQPVVQAYL